MCFKREVKPWQRAVMFYFQVKILTIIGDYTGRGQQGEEQSRSCFMENGLFTIYCTCLYLNLVLSSEVYYWKCNGLVCRKLKECQSNSLLCQAYQKVEQIVCDLVQAQGSLQIAENSHLCDVFNLTLKSISFHRGESSSHILLSALERIIFSSLQVLFHWIPV